MRPGLSTFSGVSDPNVAAPTVTLLTGSADANYPVGNLSDLLVPSKVARITPAGGAIAFKVVMAADHAAQIAALVNHTLPAGASVRVRFYADSGLSALVSGGDLGPTTIPDPVEGYPQTFPAVMDAAQTVRAVRVDIASAGADPIDLGGCEVAQWWELGGLTNSADVGFEDGGDDLALMGGGAWGRQEYHPNTYSGEVAYMDSAQSLTTGLSFLKNKALARPFVFVEDYADPATWPRTCYLASNADLPPFVAQLYDRDQVQIRVREHVR